MMLTLKTDSTVIGQSHSINLCRECVAPGTRIRFALTLDQSILKGRWTADSILKAISAFAAYQMQLYAAKFQQPQDSVQIAEKNLLMLGGRRSAFSARVWFIRIWEKARD